MVQVARPSPFAAVSQQPLFRCSSVHNSLEEILALKDEYSIIKTLHERLKCFGNPWMRGTGPATCSYALERALLSLPTPQQLSVQDLPGLAQLHITMSASLVPLLDSILGVKLPNAWLPDDALAAVVERLEAQSANGRAWSAMQNVTDLQMFHLRRARQLTDAYKQLSLQREAVVTKPCMRRTTSCCVLMQTV